MRKRRGMRSPGCLHPCWKTNESMSSQCRIMLRNTPRKDDPKRFRIPGWDANGVLSRPVPLHQSRTIPRPATPLKPPANSGIKAPSPSERTTLGALAQAAPFPQGPFLPPASITTSTRPGYFPTSWPSSSRPQGDPGPRTLRFDHLLFSGFYPHSTLWTAARKKHEAHS